MNTFSHPQSSEIKKQTDPLLFTYNMNNKININKEENSHDNKDIKDGIQSDKKKDMNEIMVFDGQGTKEMNNILNEDDKDKEAEGEGEENIEVQFVDKKKDENYNEYKNYDNGEDEDEYYYISDLIPPQNFSNKLRLAKKKHEKLQKEIDLLKKQIKKYNPNFPVRDYNYYK